MKTTKVKQLQTSANNNKEESKGSELIQRDSIKDSPFEVVTQDGMSFGVMGQYRLTEPSRDKKAVKEELAAITWNRIIQVIMVLDEIKSKLNKNDEKL